MTQVEDEKHQTLTGGPLATHRQMKERNNSNLFFCLQEEEEVAVGGCLPRVPVMLPAPNMVKHTQTKNSDTHSQQHLGVGGVTFLFVAMAT